nr:hypothetical protein [Hyphomonas sp.]
MSVVDFDDTTFATAIWPQLTPVGQPIADMAAAGLLARQVLEAAAIRGQPRPRPPRR